MKRSFSFLVFALVAITNLLGQTTETPVCFAILPKLGLTLKYKFSYGEENFITNLRLISGSDNAFKTGDNIAIQTKEGKTITFCVKENQLAEAASGYIPMETSAEEINNMQKGIKGITLVRDGESYDFMPIKDNYAYTKANAKLVTRNAYSLERVSEKKKISSEKAEARRERINAYRELKKQMMEVGIPPKIYHRVYLGYAPQHFKGSVFIEDLNFGYTGGLLLGGSSSQVYVQFGAQFDCIIIPKTDISQFKELLPKEKLKDIEETINEESKDEYSVSLPIDITRRFYLGHSNVALSPFAGAVLKINPRHSIDDGMLLQPGLEFGLNLDYKRFYFGTLYHVEFFTRKGLGHTRGLAARVGFSF